MSTLCLELKQGEVMILNGATLRFKTRARIELNTKARFLFGKQIMAEEDAVSMPQQLYYQIQLAYVGCASMREDALPRAREIVAEIAAAGPGEQIRELLLQINALITQDGSFDALKLARRIINLG
jgi:flagellar protein FlbT